MATNPNTKIFMATAPELRIIKKAADKVPHHVTGAITKVLGEDIQFKAGRYETDDPDEIELIRASDVFGERIYELEPQAPDPQELILRIGELAASEDTDALEAMVAEEEAGWKRQIVIDAAGKTLGLIYQRRQLAEQERQEAEAKEKAKVEAAARRDRERATTPSG